MGVLAQLAIYVVLLIGTVYSVVIGYHYFQYGSSKKTSTTALVVFLIGAGLLLIGLMVSYSLF